MQCQNCGANVGMEYRLCPYCGAEIPLPNSNANNSQQQPTIVIQNVVSSTNTNTNNNRNYSNSRSHQNCSTKSKSVAMILCILSLLGIGGLHRFYVGKTVSGVVHILTVGLFWIGTIADLKAISNGTFTDSDGLLLLK